MDAAEHRELIRKEWDTYRALVLPNAPAVQVTETCRAFYSGALVMLKVLLGDIPPGGNTVVVDVAVTAGLLAEFNAFADNMDAGRA